MPDSNPQKITVETTVNLPLEKAWEIWNEPKHIVNWNFASPEWHTPRAENDLRVGGKYSYRMEAKDGSMGFDMEGTYTSVDPQSHITSALGDDRKVDVAFTKEGSKTRITQTFDAEKSNSVEMQRAGWQAILDNFKSYAENIHIKN